MTDVLQQARELVELHEAVNGPGLPTKKYNRLCDLRRDSAPIAKALIEAVRVMKAIRDMPKDMVGFDGVRVAAIVYSDTADKYLKSIGVSD